MKQANKALLSIFAVGMVLSVGCNKSSDPITQAPGGNTGATIVTIGTQVWTAVNLNVENYRNGDPIPQVQDLSQWWNLTSGAWCYYNNDPANGNTYGKLYNGYAMNDPRGLAPAGWHIPNQAEWKTLITYIEGVGGKLKATTLWNFPNTGATNSTGFTAFPGGYRDYNGSFGDVGVRGYFGSVPEFADSLARSRVLHYEDVYVWSLIINNRHGFSVRCVKD